MTADQIAIIDKEIPAWILSEFIEWIKGEMPRYSQFIIKSNDGKITDYAKSEAS